MSWIGNTLLPICQDVFLATAPPLPSDPKVAADVIRSAGHPDEAKYIASCTPEDLQRVYAYSGLIERASEGDAWAMAEDEWNGR
jgi:hypothetical protein